MQTPCLPACLPASLWACSTGAHSRLKITAQSLSFLLKILPAKIQAQGQCPQGAPCDLSVRGSLSHLKQPAHEGHRNGVWCLFVVNVKAARCLREKAVPLIQAFLPGLREQSDHTASHLMSQVPSDGPAPPCPALSHSKGPQCSHREDFRPSRS